MVVCGCKATTVTQGGCEAECCLYSVTSQFCYNLSSKNKTVEVVKMAPTSLLFQLYKFRGKTDVDI